MLAAARFGLWDWAVVGLYLLLLLVSGVWVARREPAGADEYFLAGRRMPAWAVAFSIVASTLSVATFIGVPQMTFEDAGDLTYLSTNIGGVLAILVVAFVFIPVFYKRNVTTVYELLEQRFGRPAKYAASATFMVGRVFASGARVYIGAIPIAMILFGTEKSQEPAYLMGAIAVLTVVAVLYTLIGGIASVIWTDVIQTLVLLGAVGAGVVLILHRIPAPIDDVVRTLGHAAPGGESKLRILHSGLDLAKPWLGFDPSQRFTLLTAVMGFSLINLAAYGTDHDMAQRMLTCRNAVQGGRSAIVAICLGVPIVALFLVVGLLLFVFYKSAVLMGGSAPDGAAFTSDRVLLTFVLNEFPAGLSGLMVAGLFAVGLGSLNSAINAMAATAIKDFYTHLAPGRSQRHYLLAGRWATVAWGAVLGLFAVLCIFWKRAAPDTTLIDFALSVMTFAYSGLLAVFLTAIFTRRAGSSLSAIAALVTGFVVIGLFQPAVWAPFAGTKPVKDAFVWLRIAYPWQMFIATALAMGVCCLGRSPADTGRGSEKPAA